MRECTIAELAAAHPHGATVVDVREPAEYVGGHVPGAIPIPMGQVTARLSEIPNAFLAVAVKDDCSPAFAGFDETTGVLSVATTSPGVARFLGDVTVGQSATLTSAATQPPSN